MQFDNTNCTVGSTSTSTHAITFTVEVAASAKLISKYSPVLIAADFIINSDKSYIRRMNGFLGSSTPLYFDHMN